MSEKCKKVISIILAIIFFASITLYFITGTEWAKMAFFVMLGIVGLYNLINFSKR